MVVLAGLATVTLSAVVIFLSKQGLTEKERTSAALQGCFSDTASYIMEIGENATRPRASSETLPDLLPCRTS